MSSTTFDEYPRPTTDDEPAKIDVWKILYAIGAGGMGIVYGGQLTNGTQGAIKIINPDIFSNQLLKRFENEVLAHKLINSPYVAKLLGSNLNYDPPHLAIEFIHGRTLAKLIENKDKISERSWYQYAQQIFLGLEQIHARGLVHRDIKPANIMKLTDKEMIKIIDLGIAKSEDRMTSNRNTLIGTIPYMAPEQLLGKSATQKSDIFSAGLTLVELFTKNHPFISLENLRSIDKAIIEQAPNLNGLSPKQKSFCDKLLTKNPAERITAAEAVSLLTELIKTSPGVFGNLVKKKKVAIPVKSPAVKNKVVKKTIDPVLLGVLDEFNPETTPLVKGPIIGMSAMMVDSKVSNSRTNVSREFKYPSEMSDLISINEVFLSQINSSIFHINFYSNKLQSDVYFQGYVDKDGSLLVEAVSDDFLHLKFGYQQKQQLMELGWTSPSATNPNYSLTIANTEYGRNKAARIITETTFHIYGGNKDTEIFINPITEKLVTDIRKTLSINVASDGSFILNKEKTKSNQYEKWQIIGFFERDGDRDLVLDTLVARQIENNKVYKRQNKAWNFIGIIENPIKNGLDRSKVKSGLVFNKKIINYFDDTEAKRELLTFEGTSKYLDYVPQLSAKYQDQESNWPLTNEMIELGSDTASDFEDYLGLFTLSSSNVQKNIILGLFAKHPQTQNFYGRSDGKWKLLFESPLTYGHEIFFVTKDFISFYDKRTQKPDKPIKYNELDGFIHTADLLEDSPVVIVNPDKKLKYVEIPKALQVLMQEMIAKVEEKIGQEDADIATEELKNFMSGADYYSQAEITSQMAKLLRLLT